MKKRREAKLPPGIKKLEEGRWKVRVTVTSPKTGKRIDSTRIVEGTLAEAQAAQAALRLELLAPKAPILQRERLRSYAISWLQRRKPVIRRSTLRAYVTAVRDSIIPGIGDLYIDAITKRDIEEWVLDQSKKYAATTVNQRLTTLKTILSDIAEESGKPSPAARVRGVRVDKTHQGLTVEELAAILEAAKGSEVEPIIMMMAWTGMRWGEIAALRWSDIDESRKAITVQRSFHGGVVGKTKTSKPRSCPLPDVLRDALRAHRRKLLEEQHPGLAEGWVFATRKIDDSSKASLRFGIRWWLDKIVEKAGVKRVVSHHDFRRTFVDLMRIANVDGVVVRTITGHSDEAMSAVYSTVRNEEGSEAISKVINLVSVGSKVGVAPDSDPVEKINS